METITSSKLFTTRQGTITLGVIAAIIAAIALIVYLNSYRNSHAGNAAVSVLVAQKLIEKGTPGDVIHLTITKDWEHQLDLGAKEATHVTIESNGVTVQLDRASAQREHP